jgi:hypothetical protein
VQFLFGASADVNDPPNSSRDLNVLGNAAHLLFLDDFDKTNKNLEKTIVRISTGTKSEERTLYTNKGVTRINPDVFIGITTKWPYFSREDFLQRCLIIRLTNNGKNVSSKSIRKAVIRKRNRMWYELLNDLNKIVRRLKKRQSNSPKTVDFRMADWAEFLLRGLPMNKHAYVNKLFSKTNRDQIDFLMESNSLALPLSEWLKENKNHDRWITSGKIREDLRIIAQKRSLPFAEYENDQVFGVEMANVASTFSRIYSVRMDRRRGRNVYRFSEK